MGAPWRNDENYARRRNFGRNVLEETKFQHRLGQIGDGLQKLENIADPAVRSATKEIVQLLMEMHGSALDRMLDIVFESGETGARLIDELARDAEVSSLLVLYGLHPDDLPTRVERKLVELRSRLFKMGAEAALLSVSGGDVRIRVTLQGPSCGSTAAGVRALVEEALYEAAPELTSLVVEGIEKPSPAGFVAMAALIGTPIPAVVHEIAPTGGEGQD